MINQIQSLSATLHSSSKNDTPVETGETIKANKDQRQEAETNQRSKEESPGIEQTNLGNAQPEGATSKEIEALAKRLGMPKTGDKNFRGQPTSRKISLSHNSNPDPQILTVPISSPDQLPQKIKYRSHPTQRLHPTQPNLTQIQQH
ncbi:hypothetical protein PCASD_08677 [Puccinia coronata f. sp. avenae]|uniref:Uncharacterized protein n=1 Tax=Puccinia coronata f. sp. avenae TaxID=200324 RepID=A0A2N5UG86_9BASI|nr:hypothetical protein PCASD_08677 [Puccinia coronata f. sp. avenae]